MPVSILFLVLLAALLHASWNFIIKTTGDRKLVAWWSIASGVIIFLPVFLWKPEIPKEIWPYAVTSGLVETIYILTLVYAYSQADFSLVYPLARGTAPAFLVLWAAIFLGERLSGRGWSGLALLLVGLLIIASGPLMQVRVHGKATNRKGILAALGVAICISMYSAIDAAAVRIMDPITYNVLILGLMGLFLTPVVLIQYGLKKVLEAGRVQWKSFLAIGFFTVLTYMLVLIAYSKGHVSYTGALREVSVVFGALMGWRFLGEKLGPIRFVGAAVIFTGILLIATA